MNYKILAEGPIRKRPEMLPCRETLMVVFQESPDGILILSFWVVTSRISGENISNDNVETFDTDIRLVEQAYHDAFTRWLKRISERVPAVTQVLNNDTFPLYPIIDG